MNWENLRDWFLNEKRSLPWRDKPSPYAVWISEVMLQQTQVSVVIPYFERWMATFPTIQELAKAPLDRVIKIWEGLGYYSRARNLHEAAQYICNVHGGTLPDDEASLSKIKGLGPYTVGAILSFAFHKKAAAVDGNVLRVLTRNWFIESDISKAKTVEEIRQRVIAELPDEEPWVLNEALIEFGALICQKKPKCLICPLQRSCKAFQRGAVEDLPFKSAKIKYIQLQRSVAVILHKGKILIQRGEKGKIMSDLHEFPYWDEGFEEWIQTHNLKLIETLPEVAQSFTRYRVKLSPKVFEASSSLSIPGHQWLSQEELDNLALSSGHRKIYKNFKGLCLFRGV